MRLWAFIVLVGLLSSPALSGELAIKADGPEDDAFIYSLQTDADDLADNVRNPEEFARLLKTQFYAVLARNVAENAHDALVPILVLRGGEVDKEEYLAVGRAVMTLDRAPVPDDVEFDLLPRFYSEFKPSLEPETLIELLDHSDEQWQADKRKSWSVIADVLRNLKASVWRAMPSSIRPSERPKTKRFLRI